MSTGSGPGIKNSPANPAARARVYVGENGVLDDTLAYQAPPLAPSVRYNYVTAASSIPVLHALLPGAAPLQPVHAACRSRRLRRRRKTQYVQPW